MLYTTLGKHFGSIVPTILFRFSSTCACAFFLWLSSSSISFVRWDDGWWLVSFFYFIKWKYFTNYSENALPMKCDQSITAQPYALLRLSLSTHLSISIERASISSFDVYIYWSRIDENFRFKYVRFANKLAQFHSSHNDNNSNNNHDDNNNEYMYIKCEHFEVVRVVHLIHTCGIRLLWFIWLYFFLLLGFVR